MSELTVCNYCRLQDMKRRAKERGSKIKVRAQRDRDPLAQLYPGGMEVIEVDQDGRETELAWMAEIPDHCCC